MQDTAAQHTVEAIAQATSDATIAKVGLSMSVSGGATTVVGGLTMNEFGVIFGMFIGLIGLVLQAIQWRDHRRKVAAEIRALEAKEARELEEHRARMGMY